MIQAKWMPFKKAFAKIGGLAIKKKRVGRRKPCSPTDAAKNCDNISERIKRLGEGKCRGIAAENEHIDSPFLCMSFAPSSLRPLPLERAIEIENQKAPDGRRNASAIDKNMERC